VGPHHLTLPTIHTCDCTSWPLLPPACHLSCLPLISLSYLLPMHLQASTAHRLRATYHLHTGILPPADLHLPASPACAPGAAPPATTCTSSTACTAACCLHSCGILDCPAGGGRHATAGTTRACLPATAFCLCLRSPATACHRIYLAPFYLPGTEHWHTAQPPRLPATCAAPAWAAPHCLSRVSARLPLTSGLVSFILLGCVDCRSLPFFHLHCTSTCTTPRLTQHTGMPCAPARGMPALTVTALLLHRLPHCTVTRDTIRHCLHITLPPLHRLRLPLPACTRLARLLHRRVTIAPGTAYHPRFRCGRDAAAPYDNMTALLLLCCSLGTTSASHFLPAHLLCHRACLLHPACLHCLHRLHLSAPRLPHLFAQPPGTPPHLPIPAVPRSATPPPPHTCTTCLHCLLMPCLSCHCCLPGTTSYSLPAYSLVCLHSIPFLLLGWDCWYTTHTPVPFLGSAFFGSTDTTPASTRAHHLLPLLPLPALQFSACLHHTPAWDAIPPQGCHATCTAHLQCRDYCHCLYHLPACAYCLIFPAPPPAILHHLTYRHCTYRLPALTLPVYTACHLGSWDRTTAGRTLPGSPHHCHTAPACLLHCLPATWLPLPPAATAAHPAAHFTCFLPPPACHLLPACLLPLAPSSEAVLYRRLHFLPLHTGGLPLSARTTAPAHHHHHHLLRTACCTPRTWKNLGLPRAGAAACTHFSPLGLPTAPRS